MTDARRFLFPAFFLAVAIVAIAPIRNYDFFWHLATGRWIVEHGALPLRDPFTVASDRSEWVNGEWLFEIVVYGVERVVGVVGLSVVGGLLAALVFVGLIGPIGPMRPIGLALSAIAFAGAMPTFDVRPASVALVFLVLALRARSPVAHAIIAALWMNVHPSALLAPGVAALSTRRVAPTIASALALLLNPYGLRGILAPVELTLFARSGQFVNTEWLPSSIARFPLLYICIGIAAIAFGTAENRREHWWRALLLGGFAWLAMEHVRNQGLFFAAFAVLVAPMVRADRIQPRIVYAAAVLVLVFVGLTADHRLGAPPERFPIAAVARLKASGLPGHIYNPDQFGGFLIWSFYPHRRALTDGRNELYHAFIPEYAHARTDERAWRALVAKYRIDLAVDEYRPPLQVMNAVTREVMSMPASLAYWPRQKWALIAFDEAGMVFARRAAFPPEVLEKWEIRGVVPDARMTR